MLSFLKKWAPIIAAALVIWSVMTFANGDFLYRNGDLSLFIFGVDFLSESLNIPGGALSWLGSFFTQFLLIPWLGALLWVIMLFLAAAMTVRTFGIPSGIRSMALIPVALLIIGNMSLGYGIYAMRAQDYFFAPTIGYIIMLAIMNAVWNTGSTWKKAAVLAASAFAGFILTGIFALAGVLAAGIGAARKKRIWPLALSLLLFFVVPYIEYGLFTTFRFEDSWSMGLPAVSSQSWASRIRIPYLILFVSVLMFSLARPMFDKFRSAERKITTVTRVCSTVLAVIVISCFWFKDASFSAELKMSRAVDNCDWQKVVDIFDETITRESGKETTAFNKMEKELLSVNDKFSQAKIVGRFKENYYEPTNLMVIFKDLALLKMGQALDTAFSRKDGNRIQKSVNEIPLTFQAGPQIYFNYGLVNMEYRWLLECTSLYGWSFSSLRYMAMHGIIMGEQEFASKFLEKLDRTLLFRKWSRSQRVLSNDRQAMSQELPYIEILPYMGFDDRLSSDLSDMSNFLEKHFTQDRDTAAMQEFDSAALLWAMRSRNPELFSKALGQYLESFKGDTLPLHVQEAVALFGTAESGTTCPPVSKEVLDRFNSFKSYTIEHRADNESYLKLSIWKRFGDTYLNYFIAGQ